jgi:pimeloyl-ACP methyl ester carboxylesterase
MMAAVIQKLLLRVLNIFPPGVGMLTGGLYALYSNPFLVLQLIYGRPFTPPIKGHNSIAELRDVMINGVTHSALIRGQNRDAPVILVLHGGPGATDIPFCSAYGRFLEQSFVVVHYDQRGACKSAAANLKRPDFLKTLTVEQHVNDAIKFSEWLVHESGLSGAVSGLNLIGGSWGSMLALFSLKRRPDLFKKCILRGLVTDTAKSEKQGMQFLTQRMQHFHFSGKEIDEVKAIGAYPYGTDIDRLLRQREWLSSLGGMSYAGGDISEPIPRWELSHSFSAALFLAPEVSLWEIMCMKPAMVATLRSMWPAIEGMDMLQAVGGGVGVPLCVVHGQADHCTAHELVLSFLQALRAPGKHVVWFGRSG